MRVISFHNQCVIVHVITIHYGVYFLVIFHENHGRPAIDRWKINSACYHMLKNNAPSALKTANGRNIMNICSISLAIGLQDEASKNVRMRSFRPTK